MSTDQDKSQPEQESTRWTGTNIWVADDDDPWQPQGNALRKDHQAYTLTREVHVNVWVMKKLDGDQWLGDVQFHNAAGVSWDFGVILHGKTLDEAAEYGHVFGRDLLRLAHWGNVPEDKREVAL